MKKDNKVVDLLEYKRKKPSNKVIEIDFKNKVTTSVKEFRGDRLVKNKTLTKPSGDDHGA